MPRGIPLHWPDDDELLRLAAKHGNVAAVARSLGQHVNPLHQHLQRSELMERFKAAAKTPKLQEQELGTPVSETETLRSQVKELQRALTKARAEDIREQRVIDTLERLVPAATPSYEPRPAPTTRTGQMQTLVLQFSDLHAGEVVSREQTNGLNEYNWEIMLARLDRLRERLLSWRDIVGNVEHLVIAWLGDMVSGDIHDELAQTNEVPLDETVVRLGMDLGAWIESLVPEFPKITVACVDGNHSRRDHKPRHKNRYSNADWQTAHFTRLHLRRFETVEFEIPKAARHVVEVYDRRLLLMHGDGIRSTMVGVPWGGIKRRTESMIPLFQHDHVLAGHFHEVNVGFGGRVFINGSLVGPNEYSLANYGTGEPPRQQLVPFHPKYGAGGALWLDV